MKPTIPKRLLGFILISCILLLAFWIRTQGTSRIPYGQFTGTDPYLYYWQAQLISEHGHLPARDMHRWLPLGRDLGQTLNLYSYALAYVHKAVSLCFSSVSLYEISIYAPPVCFVIGLGVLCLFFYHTYGVFFSSIVGMLLATFPGAISRSSAGFSDRDSWCFMIGILAVITYLVSLQTQRPRNKLLWTFASGIFVFLGGLSWEGFGFFVAIILAVELWRFCTTDTEEHQKEYLLWMLFVPTLYLASPVYRSGYGFSTHVAALLLFPPIVIFFLRSIRYLLLDFFKGIRSYARHLAWFLTLISLTMGVCYVVINFDTFALTAYPFHENRLMRSIDELADPRFSHWWQHYGSGFILGALGLVIESLRVWKWKGIPLGAALTIFFATAFFRFPVTRWIGADLCNMFFFAALVLVLIGLGIACLRKERSENELVMLITVVWIILWVGLARGGKRYTFFACVPLAFGTALLLWLCPLHLIQMLKPKFTWNFCPQWVTACVTGAVFLPILFWSPFGGHVAHAVKEASKVRNPAPGRGEVSDAFQWMKTELPNSTIVAANWGFGSQLNVLGGVKTIIDQDHYIPHWVHLYYRHVFCAQSEREALSFLKTHGVTHLMITQKEVITLSKSHSLIGSDVNLDRHFRVSKLHQNKNISTETFHQMILPRGTSVTSVEITITSPEKRSVTVHSKRQNPVSEEVVWNANKPAVIGIGNSGVILYFDFEGKPYIGYYIPPLGWNSFAFKLFMRGEHSAAFEPIYPANDQRLAKVKVWKIHYPLDIKTDPRFLETEAGESLR